MSDTLNYKTNIPELDALIGRQRIKPGTILIIKGGPGSGKTTLGLQILKKHLEKNRSLEGTFCAAFISLEIPHAKILNYVNVSYHFGLTCDKNDCDRYLFVASREDIEKEISQSFSNETHMDPGDAIFQSLKHLDCELGEENKEEQKSFEEYKRNNSYNFIFIDNLNILVDIITDQTTYNLDIRKALNYICRSFTEEPNNTVFIFSVEYHSSMHEINTIISESFMCDYEVLLNVEPIYGDFRKIKSDINALGYYIETDKQGMEKSIETRSFCRVLKARYSKNLSLRYAYDIVEGKGIEFYNTYPGDGEINLFYENKPQEDHWENCFNYDIKFSYPSLRKDKFDKSSLQRTFSSLRQLKHIPEKTDLYLTSLDNYWINWYADLKRKWFIYDIVNANFRHGKERRADVAQSEEKKLVNVVTNIIHRELTRNDFKRERLKHRITARIKVEPASFKSILNESNEDPERYIKYIKQEVSEEICSAIHNFLSEEPLYHCFECNYTIWLFETLHSMLPKQSIEFHKEEFEIIRSLRQAERKKWLERVRKELDRLKRENEEISDAYYYLDSMYQLFLIIGESQLGVKACPNHNLALLIRFQEILKKHRSETLNEEEWKDIDQFIRELDGQIDTEKDNLKDVKVNRDFHSMYNYLKSDKDYPTYAVLRKKFICRQCVLDEKHIIHNKLQKVQDKIVSKIDFQMAYNDIKTGGIDFNIDNLTEVLFDYYSAWLVGIFKKKEILDVLKQLEKIPAFEKHREEYIAKFFSCFVNSYYRLRKEDPAVVLLKKIPTEKVKLFGEIQSDVIKELDEFHFKGNRPIHYADKLFSLRDKQNYISVPYNANISYMVYRKDLLKTIYTKLKSNPRSLTKYREGIEHIIRSEFNVLKHIKEYETFYIKSKKDYFISNSRYFDDILQEKKRSQKLDKYISDSFDKELPTTWEELIALSYFVPDTPYKLLIETDTFDTLLATFLEMFWSFGGDINVLPDYHILNPNDTFTQLYMALHLLGLMSWNNKSIIPRNSTIDPAELNRRSMFSTAPWLFARQWHSTFVEYLTCDKKKLTITRFLKKNKSADFEIMPIPVSLFSYLARDKIPEHTSCWGDWHFAITDGSENLELGISVINNLMSSRKIPERAFSMADLPTVEKFYKLYGDVKCFNSHRMPSEKLPSVTFNDMRSGYFKNAKSRTQIFDYRHTMRELAAVIRFAHFGAFSSCPMNDDIIPDNTFNKKVYRRLYKAFENIDNFKYDNIMIS